MVQDDAKEHIHYIYIYVEEALSGIGLMSTFRSATIYIYILLSNDLGQRDASDIPIWLPPGLSHVP